MAEVKFKFVGDDSELRKKLANLSKIQSEMTDKFAKNFGKTIDNGMAKTMREAAKEAANAAKNTEIYNRSAANKDVVNAKIDHINKIRDLHKARSQEISDLNILKQIEQEHKATLASKKKDTESLVQEQKMLNIQYKQGQIDIQTYNHELKRQAEERRKATEEERKAVKVAKDAEKARKDAEREAAKQAKETEKRKKQLEQESSEYYKLNKALGAVRKEAKDVLAEMFRMERQGHANTLGYEALRKKSEGLTKQTQYLDQGIKKIDASLGLHQRNVGNYGQALELISPQFASINQKLQLFGTSIEDLAGKPSAIKELGASFVGIGKSILSFLLSPIGLAITALGGLFALFQSNKQTVIDFDAGLKNVSKTTNITGQDLDNFGDAIINLSRKLKVVDASKLLEYATVAGQLGVKGTKDILAFTEALAMLETASNISGEEGGADIARMLTLVDGGVQNVKAFGDEIVNLGNNFAATEKEILDNATQIAQNVGIYKIGRQEILAFATATKAVGLEAELVGSTFSRTLGEFEKSIRSGKGVDDLLKIIGGTSQELSKRFKDDAAGVFVDYVRGLNSINIAGGSVNEALERTGIIAVRDQRVIASLASNGYGVLTDALGKVKDAQGAMQAEFENGSSKIEQQSKRIGVAWDNLVLSIENGSGVIGKASVSIMGFFADIIEAITPVTNATDLLVKKFQEQQAEHNKLTESVAPLISRYNTLSTQVLKTKGEQDELKSITKQLAEILPSAVTEWDKYGNAVSISTGRINDMTSAQQKLLATMNKGAISDVEKDIKKQEFALDNYQRSLKEFADKGVDVIKTGGQGFGDSGTVKYLKDVRAGLESTNNELTLSLVRLQELGGKLTAEQRNILARDGFDKAGQGMRDYDLSKNKNTVTPIVFDEEEDAKAKRQEEKQRQAREKAQQDAKRLIEDQRQAQARIDEVNEQARRQSLSKEKQDILAIQDKYKKLWEQVAKDREKGLLINTSGLKESEQADIAKYNADVKKKEQDEIEKKQKEAYQAALKLAEDFGQAELAIREKYQKALNDLGGKATEGQKVQLQQNLMKELESLIDSSPEFQKAMQMINESSEWLVGQAFQNGKDAVISLIDGMKGATSEQKDQLRKVFGKFFDEGISNAKIGKLDDIQNLTQGFGQLVNQALEFDSSLSDSLGTIANMISTVGQLSTTFGGLTKNLNMLSLGKGLGIMGAFAGIVGGITSYFSQKQSIAQQQMFDNANKSTQMQLKATEAITQALQKQVDLIEDIYGAERLSKYNSTLKDIQSNWSDINNQLSGKYQLTGDAVVDDMITKINNGLSKDELTKGVNWDKLPGILKTYYSIIDGKATSKFSPLTDDITKAQEELLKLEQLANSGRADENTQNLINQLRSQIDLYNEVANKFKEEITGSSFSGILNDVKNLFLNEGENAAEAWSKGFDKILENYMMQTFTRDYLQKQMQGWYNMLDDFAGDGIDASERDILSEEWDKIRKEGESRLEEIRSILGLSKDIQSNSSLKAEEGIQRMTEETGSEIVGMYRAGYDIWKRQLIALDGINSTSANHLRIATDKLTALNAIQTNTANTVSRLDMAVTELQEIKKALR